MIVRRPTRTAATGRRPRAAVLAIVGTLLLAATTLAPAATAATPERATYRTQALPAAASMATGARTHHAGAQHRSRIVLRADRRFSLVALRWSTGAAIAGRMRAQRLDGSWSDWTELESDGAGDDGVVEGSNRAQADAARKRTAVVGRQGSTDPIWTGPARRLVVELTSARPRGLRAAFVDVTGRLPRVTGRAARAGADTMAGIHPRTDWDPGNECKPRAAPSYGSVQAVAVHHTAGSNDYTAAQVPAVLLAICKYHTGANDWNDIGYNVLVDRYGGAWEGRAGGLTNAVIGAHAQGFNSVSAGISMLGEFTAVSPPPAQVATVARVAAWKLAVAGVPRTGTVALESAGGSLSRYGAGKTAVLPRVFGHRDVGLTACPGNVGYTILPGVRTAVANASPVIPTGLPAPGTVVPTQPTITPKPEPVRITISTARRLAVGSSAVITGTARQGTRLMSREAMALQVGQGGKWLTVDRARTTAGGKYRFTRKFSRSWSLRVARTATAGAETSAAVPVVVVPKLTLTVPRRLALGKTTTLRGTIKPSRGPITMTVERRLANGSYAKGSSIRVQLRGRTITAKVTPHSATLYRFRLVYAGSALAGAATSGLAFGRVVRSGPVAGGASAG